MNSVKLLHWVNKLSKNMVTGFTQRMIWQVGNLAGTRLMPTFRLVLC